MKTKTWFGAEPEENFYNSDGLKIQTFIIETPGVCDIFCLVGDFIRTAQW